MDTVKISEKNKNKLLNYIDKIRNKQRSFRIRKSCRCKNCKKNNYFFNKKI